MVRKGGSVKMEKLKGNFWIRNSIKKRTKQSGECKKTACRRFQQLQLRLLYSKPLLKTTREEDLRCLSSARYQWSGKMSYSVSASLWTIYLFRWRTGLAPWNHGAGIRTEARGRPGETCWKRSAGRAKGRTCIGHDSFSLGELGCWPREFYVPVRLLSRLAYWIKDKRRFHDDCSRTILSERCPNVHVFPRRLPGDLSLIFPQISWIRGRMRL